MKITIEFLEKLGFRQQKNNNYSIDTWHWTHGGLLYIIKCGPDWWHFYPPGTMDPNYYYIDTVEDMFRYTYEDGKENGRADLRKELRDLIGAKGD